MTNLNQYFIPGPQGTLALKAGANFSFKGDNLQVFDNTEIDRWFVGSFSSANYFITVEFDSNRKETLQVLVVARPEHASFTVYGRTSVDDQLINITAEVNSSWLSLRATPSAPAYAGARICLSATYAETMLPLKRPTTVITVNPGSGTGSGSSTGVTGTRTFGIVGVVGQQDITADAAEDKLNFVAGDGIALTTVPESNSLKIDAFNTGFSSISVAGQPTIQGGTTNTAFDNETVLFDNEEITFGQSGTLTLVGSGLVSITTDAVANQVIIGTATGALPTLAVTGLAAMNTITASGNVSTDGTLAVIGASTFSDVTVNGNITVVGASTIINSSSVEISAGSIVLARTATTGLQANGAGILIQGAGAALKWNNEDNALTVNKHLAPEFGNNLSLGSPDKVWNSVYALTLVGSIASPAQTNITSLGALDSLTVVGNVVCSSNLSAVNITSSGIINIATSSEKVIDVASAGAVTYDFSQSAIFYHVNSPTVDWTAAFTNLPITVGRAVTVNVVVPQGTTPYKITACTVDGLVQSILWTGSTVPNGTASKTDIWAFTLIRRTGAWIVLASLSPNFG